MIDVRRERRWTSAGATPQPSNGPRLTDNIGELLRLYM